MSGPDSTMPNAFTAEEGHHSGAPSRELLPAVFLAVMLALYATGILTQIFGVDSALIATVAGGCRIFWNSLNRLLARRLDSDLTVTIAALAAILIGQYTVAAEVVLILLIGRALEGFAVGKSRDAIASLQRLMPQTATVRRNGAEIQLSAEAVVVGDLVLVRPGERFPIDGIVRSGQTTVDLSLLTGESAPVHCADGSEVRAGTLNGSGQIEVEATAVRVNTLLGQIAREVAAAERRIGPTQRLADRWSRLFVLLFVGAGALSFAYNYVALHGLLDIAFSRAASVLIIACPCALVLATPTAVAAAIGRLARRGALVRGGVHVEALSQVNCVVFDKTGTLTTGRPELAGIVPLDGAGEDEALRRAAQAQRASTHPFARCIVSAWQSMSNEAVSSPDSATEQGGYGVSAVAEGRQLLVGSRRLLRKFDITVPADVETQARGLETSGNTVIFMAADGGLSALFAIADPARPGAASVISSLRALGIERIELLTGDMEDAAAAIASATGISDYRASLLPAEKAARIRELRKAGYRVAFVGDGINDAPALAEANVGVAMGSAGADVAVDSAGMVLFGDRLEPLVEALLVCRAAVTLIERNIVVFGIGLNLAAVAITAAGSLSWLSAAIQSRLPELTAGAGTDFSPQIAAVLHQAASLLVVGSALRLLTMRVSPPSIGNGSKKRRGATLYGRLRSWLLALAVVELMAAVRERLLESVRAHPMRTFGISGLVVIIVWLMTGWRCVPMGQAGVVQRFGRRAGSPLAPGLHFRLPWPAETVTLIDTGRVRRAEIGFRTVTPAADRRQSEVGAVEWSSAHGGSVQRVADEALLLTGDEYLADAALTLQYRVRSPEQFLFRSAEAETLLRQSAEAALRRAAERTPLETLLTIGLGALEAEVQTRVQADCDRFETGLVVVEARLQEVHPPQEVVAAYRDVSSAFEEKATFVNQAEAYRNETLPSARGAAAQRSAEALGYRADRTLRASGEGNRFARTLDGFHAGKAVNAQRLYLETVEQALAPPTKFILDSHAGGRRQLWLSDGPLFNLPSLPAAEPAAPFVPPVEQGQ